ncbi:MAG: hypothetical protein AABM67_18130 [Acidobacteriota bacterium]
MNNLKRLGVVLALTLVFAASAFACGTPDPGQIQTPPCAVADPTSTTDEPAVPTEITTLGESRTETASSVAEVAINLFVSLLALF